MNKISRNMIEQDARIEFYETFTQRTKNKVVENLTNNEMEHNAEQEDYYSIVGSLERPSRLKNIAIKGTK